MLLHPHDCFVTTDLYYSIPSPFSASAPSPLPLTTFSLLSVSMRKFLIHILVLGQYMDIFRDVS